MRRFSIVVLLLAVTCAAARDVWAQDSTGSGPPAPDTSAPVPAATPKDAKQHAREADKFRLTTEEIDASNLPNAYELVDRLRRPWLRKDALTGAPVVLYMDEQNIGGPDKLRDIPAADIAELQYLRNEQAVQRWGATAVAGSVIVVVRRR
jgi:hypothetical protein